MSRGAARVIPPASPADELASRLARLEDRYEGLQEALSALESAPVPPHLAGPPASPETPLEPAYGDAVAWVEEWFAPVFARRLGATHWCAAWWRHDEAALRLEALWRSWEMARADGGLGMASWLRDHLDAQLRVLFAPDGPFQACDGDAHNPPPALPTSPVPPGWRAAPAGSTPSAHPEAPAARRRRS